MNAMERERAARFEALMNAHAGIVFRVVRTYCRQPEDQLDLAQEIKLQLWRAFSKYDPSRVFSTWMYRIALNTAISWTRKATISVRPLEIPTPPETEPRAAELYALIDGLDPMNRALLMLYLDDLTHAEIGDVLGITPINVATKISRLKQRLRDQVKSENASNGT